MQEKLIILLKKNSLSQHWLAKFLNISDKQVAKKLTGDAPFKSDEMFKISDFFDLPVEEIFLPRMYEKRT